MAANDPDFASVKLLLHMDGANDGTTFTDVSGHTISRSGNTCTKTATKQFGTASAYFDGNGDYLSFTTGSEFDFGTGDFTIEAWINIDAGSSGPREILCKFTSFTADVDFIFEITTAGNLALYAGDSVPINIASNSALSTGQWYHVAACRASGVTRLFVDGVVQTATHTGSVNIPNGKTTATIGANGYSSLYFKGYIDDIRVTKGVARYTATFTPPTAAHPNYGRYLAGTITEDTNHSDFIVRAHRLDTGAMITELASTGGAYEIPITIANVDYIGPVMLSAYQKLGTVWAANTAYASDSYVFPPDTVADPHVFRCTTAGTSHATTEPTWDTTPGNTTSDGSVTWTCQGRMVQPLLQGPLIPSI